MNNWKKALKISVSYLLLLIAIYFILAPSGVLQEYLSLDLSFLTQPLMILILLLLSSRLVSAATEQNYAKAISVVIDGFALAFFVYMLFGVTSPFLSNYAGLATFAFLAIVGIAVARVKNLVRNESLKRVLSGASVMLIGYALWKASIQLSQDLGSFYLSLDRLAIGPLVLWEGRLNARFGLADFENAFFAGLIFVAAALVFSSAVGSKNSVVRDVSNWLYRSQLRNFLIGFFFGLYFLTLRPILTFIFPTIQLFEWTIGGFIVSRAYSGFKSELDKRYTVSLTRTPWTKHVQKITYRMDEDFEALKDLQETFVEGRVKGPLMLYLTTLLSKSGCSIEQMDQILGSLISYEDEKIPLIAFGWEKKRIVEKNRKRRQDMLGDLMQTLSSS
ncbi:MAG: hypothetical protein NWE76_06770 [Candidatus Bathyarchaeota archaeon]|nr:hypothetical protein [Candidatus Bathyarchaeota archaeon]